MNVIEKLKQLVEKYEYVEEFDPYILQTEVDNWPMIPEMIWDEETEEDIPSGDLEELDLENWYIKRLNDYDFTIMCGGDWQEGYEVLIALVQDTLKVKSFRKLKDDEWNYDDEIDIEHILFG